jgi:signal transduction histidine kinase
LLAAALVLLSGLLHEVVEDTAVSMESVRLAQGIEIRLFQHERAADGLARSSVAADLGQMVTAAHQNVASDTERALVREVERLVRAYLATDVQPGEADAGSQAPDRVAIFEAAIAHARELVHLNIEESRSTRAVAMRWDRLATAAGAGLGAASVLGVLLVLTWLRASTYRRAMELGLAIDRLGKGDQLVRVPEEGPVELRDIARQFNRMVDALQQQSQRRQAFLASLAHELRNPLGVLKLASGAFPPGCPLPPEARIRTTLARIDRQVGRLDRMVWDFLDASRIEAGVLELRMEDCDLRQLADAVVDLFAPVTTSHELVVSSSDVPVVTRCDPLRVEQVLTNLVSNAIKYSPAGGVVEVSVRRDAGAAHVSVSDHGPGIPQEDMARLFEPFRRGAASQGAIPGVGLGLFVTRRIVEAHGGALRVESLPARGSRFEVILPLADNVS